MTQVDFLPWWIGGPVLGLVVTAHLAWTGRLLSVSGIFARAMRWRSDEREREAEVALGRGQLDEALLAATLEQFGPEAAALLDNDVKDAPEGPCGASPTVRLPVSAGVGFLLCLVVGGALSAWSTGQLGFEWNLGSGHTRLVASRPLQLILPALGGLLVGFGGRMAGGCTSSHGLSGCARLQTGSFAATAAFFAGGVGASLVIGALA